jgi:hypothetical protein
LNEEIKRNKFIRPIFRAFSLEPEEFVLTKEESEAKAKEAQEAQQAAMQAEMDAKAEMMQTQSLLQEKMAVSSDDRKREINEREILMTQGNQLVENAGFEKESILLREIEEQGQQEAMAEEMQGEQEDKQLDQETQNLQSGGQQV